jgi:hypothetical protein
MNRKHAVKAILVAAVSGLLVFTLSLGAQALKARRLQSVGWSICGGYISTMFDSASVHGILGATFSALLFLVRRQDSEASHVEPSA